MTMSNELQNAVIRWGEDIVEYYQWEKFNASYQAILNNIALRTTWTQACVLFNHAMLERHHGYNQGEKAVGQHDDKSIVQDPHLPLEVSDIARVSTLVEALPAPDPRSGDTPMAEEVRKRVQQNEERRTKDGTLSYDMYGLLVPSNQSRTQEQVNQATSDEAHDQDKSNQEVMPQQNKTSNQGKPSQATSNEPNGPREVNKEGLPPPDQSPDHQQSTQVVSDELNGPSELDLEAVPTQQVNGIVTPHQKHDEVSEQTQAKGSDGETLFNLLDVFNPDRSNWCVRRLILEHNDRKHHVERAKENLALVVNMDNFSCFVVIRAESFPAPCIYIPISQVDQVDTVISRLQLGLEERTVYTYSGIMTCAAAVTCDMHHEYSPDVIQTTPWKAALAQVRDDEDSWPHPPSSLQLPNGNGAGTGQDKTMSNVDTVQDSYVSDDSDSADPRLESFNKDVQTCDRILRLIDKAETEMVRHSNQTVEAELQRQQSVTGDEPCSSLVSAPAAGAKAATFDLPFYRGKAKQVREAIRDLKSSTEREIGVKVWGLKNRINREKKRINRDKVRIEKHNRQRQKWASSRVSLWIRR